MDSTRQNLLFDPPEKKESGKQVLSVSELTRRIKACIEANVGYVWLCGEVSGFRIHDASGHAFFRLKDPKSVINAVMWASNVRMVRFNIEDGMEMIVHGRVSVFESSGQYQIYVEHVQPRGIGALQLAFQQLKTKLEKEGLFDPSRKRPLPAMPRRIAIVTSPVGAALRDMLNIIHRRFPAVEVVVHPVRVQGEGAAVEIAAAIGDANRMGRVDVIIVGRGGGSVEELWAFNEEIVARAICASELPVISAVGHEVDVTISDLVADRRALTPSEAAEIVVPVRDEVLADLDELNTRLAGAIAGAFAVSREKLDGLLESYALRHPQEIVTQLAQRLDQTSMTLVDAIGRISYDGRARVGAAAGKLDALSPLAVLGRGYSVTRLAETGRIVKSADDVRGGQDIVTWLGRGSLVSKVLRTAPESADGGRRAGGN
jgi:exodeoxyribonuclease VII large subunit